jgi:glycosidase
MTLLRVCRRPVTAGILLASLTGCFSSEELTTPSYNTAVRSDYVDAGIPYDPRLQNADTTPAEEDTALPDTGEDAPLFPDDTAPVEDTTIAPPTQLRSCATTISHRPSSSVASVAAAGEFNSWSTSATPLADADGDGTWTAEVTLAPGEYAFKFAIGGVLETSVPPDVYTKWTGGSENRNLIVGDCQKPLLGIISATATGEGSLIAEVQFSSAADAAPIDPATVRVTVGEAEVTPTVDATTGRITVATDGLVAGKHSLRVTASDTSGRAAENGTLYIPLWVEAERFDWRDAVMYFTFVDRFRDGDNTVRGGAVPGVDTRANYQGGDFKGILDTMRSGYFERMGVRLIWLSPVYDNPDGGFEGNGENTGRQFSGYHGYWPINGTGIEGRFGDTGAGAAERLKELIAEAHSRGIRVLFDLVTNHVHDQHEYVRAHPNWFQGSCGVCGTAACPWDSRPIDCLFASYLPDLDYKKHEVTQQITSDVIALAKEFDVDAFRVDAAKHMDHVIMRRLAMKIRDEVEQGQGAPYYLVGETFTGGDDAGRQLIMNYVAPYELDGQFDFPLYWAIRNAFAGGGSFIDLDNAVGAGERYYRGALQSPFLGNHDIVRFASQVTRGNDNISPWESVADPMFTAGSVTEWNIINRLSMGFLFTLTQPGVPLIYYGDEVGLAGGRDPDNRRMMPLDSALTANHRELLGRVQAIGTARAASEALRRGVRRTLYRSGELYVYGLASAPGKAAIVAMNKGGQQAVQVELPAEWALTGTLTDSLGGSRTASVASNRISLTLNSWEYVILEP